jgi:hypothetical protein
MADSSKMGGRMFFPASLRPLLAELKGAPLAVLCCYASHADKRGLAWPSIKLLCRETGYGVVTVKKARRKLVELGLLEATGRDRDQRGRLGAKQFRLTTVRNLSSGQSLSNGHFHHGTVHHGIDGDTTKVFHREGILLKMKVTKPCQPDGSPPGQSPSAVQGKPNPDPRHRAVVELYTQEFERRYSGLKAPLDGSDGKALQLLLRQQVSATVEQIKTWLMNAFNSEPDAPPLRAGFRLREFCAHALKYTAGPLKRGGSNKRCRPTGAYHSGDPTRTYDREPDLIVNVP